METMGTREGDDRIVRVSHDDKTFKAMVKDELDRHGIIVHDDAAIPYVTDGSGGDASMFLHMLSDWLMADPRGRWLQGEGHDGGRLVVVCGGHPVRSRLAYGGRWSQVLFLVAEEYREAIAAFAVWCSE